MANTIFDSSTNTAVQRQLYAKAAYLWATKNSFFSKFVGRQVLNMDALSLDKSAISKGNGTDTIITLNDSLAKEKGDTVNFNILAPLSGEGVLGDNILEGNEEALTYYAESVTVNQIRNAVRVSGMSEQRTFKNCMSDAKELLQLWMAEHMEKQTTLALSGLASSCSLFSATAPSSNRKLACGVDAATMLTFTNETADSFDSDLDATNEVFGTKVISVAKRKAQECAAGYPKLRPIKFGGKDYYVMLIHPLQAKQLKMETAWINAQKDALPEGKDNPIFTGKLGVWDGVVVHEYDRIETRLGDGVGTAATTYFESGDAAGNGVYIARSLFLGAQAAVWGVAKKMSFKEKEFDYGNQMGVSVGMIWCPQKVQFNSQDYGTMIVDTAIVPD